MRYVIVGLVAIGMMGCATGGVTYDKAGMTVAQRDQDRVACAQVGAGGDSRKVGPVLVALDNDAVDECMRQRGYTRRPARD